MCNDDDDRIDIVMSIGEECDDNMTELQDRRQPWCREAELGSGLVTCN